MLQRNGKCRLELPRKASREFFHEKQTKEPAKEKGTVHSPILSKAYKFGPHSYEKGTLDRKFYNSIPLCLLMVNRHCCIAKHERLHLI